MTHFTDGLLLLNKEVVITEIMELAALKISGILKVKPDAVTASLELEDGKLVPKFEVSRFETDGLSSRDVEEVMATVYHQLKIDLALRIRAMRNRRCDFQEGPTAKE